MGTKEREVLLDLINKYREFPCLWQRDHEDYLKKYARAEAYKVLLKIYHRFDEYATMITIRKKIDNLRCNYSKELKKVLASKYAGEEEYVPSLWYYNAFRFLEPRLERNFKMAESQIKETKLEYLENENQSSDEQSNITPSRGKKRKDFSIIEREDEEYVIPETSQNSGKDDDLWEIYGKSIGYQLRSVDEKQLVFCQKLISDAIYYAKLGRLDENSRVAVQSREPRFHEVRIYPSTPSPEHGHTKTEDDIIFS